jgi:hypothetical protein
VAPARTLYTAIVKNEAFLAVALMPGGNYLANLVVGNPSCAVFHAFSLILPPPGRLPPLVKSSALFARKIDILSPFSARNICTENNNPG